MTKWFRWYAGTTEDGKFRVVARNANVTVRDVIALWAFVLEDASSDKHRGVCTRGSQYMDAILGFDNGVAGSIVVEMEALQMIEVNGPEIIVINWGLRQFETDTKDGTNATRQKRFRDRKKTENKQHSNGHVTDTKRPDTETETYKKSEFESWYLLYPKKEARGSAEKAYKQARKSTEAAVLLDGVKKAAERYRACEAKYIPLSSLVPPSCSGMIWSISSEGCTTPRALHVGHRGERASIRLRMAIHLRPRIRSVAIHLFDYCHVPYPEIWAATLKHYIY